MTIEVGATACLLLNQRPALSTSIVRVRSRPAERTVAGGAPMSPEVARRVTALFREIRPPERADYQLTPRERAS